MQPPDAEPKRPAPVAPDDATIEDVRAGILNRERANTPHGVLAQRMAGHLRDATETEAEVQRLQAHIIGQQREAALSRDRADLLADAITTLQGS